MTNELFDDRKRALVSDFEQALRWYVASVREVQGLEAQGVDIRDEFGECAYNHGMAKAYADALYLLGFAEYRDKLSKFPMIHDMFDYQYNDLEVFSYGKI